MSSTEKVRKQVTKVLPDGTTVTYEQGYWVRRDQDGTVLERSRGVAAGIHQFATDDGANGELDPTALSEFQSEPPDFMKARTVVNDVDGKSYSAMGVDESEHDALHALTDGHGDPRSVQRYLDLRNGGVSTDDINGYINAGFGELGYVEALHDAGVSPEELVESDGDGGWRQRPEWREWQEANSSFDVARGDSPLADKYEREMLEMMGIPENEHDILKEVTSGRPSPRRVKSYYTLRGTDLNSRARSRKCSEDDMRAYAAAGFDHVSEIEKLTKRGVRPEDLVDENGGLRPEWQEHKSAHGRLRMVEGSLNSGRFQTPLDHPNLRIAWIDLETNGIEENGGGKNESRGTRAVEVAVVVTDINGNVLDRHHTLIDPGPTTSYMGETHDNYARVGETSEIHGITPSDLAGSPTWAEQSDHLYGMLDSTPDSPVIVGGHNIARFDALAMSMEEHHSRGNKATGVKRPTYAVFDTMNIERRFGSPEGGLSLGAVAAERGVSGGRAHTAMGDAETTAAVGVQQLRELRNMGVKTIGSRQPPPSGQGGRGGKPRTKAR